MARTENKIQFIPGKRFSLKDHLFNEMKVLRLASEIKKVYPVFKQKQFVNTVMEQMLNLELKARIEHIVDCLTLYLPNNFEQALKIILEALPETLDPTKTDEDYGDYLYEVYNSYIARHGCNEQYFDLSMEALEQTTQRFSAEFALRYFIKFDEQTTLRQVTKWSQDKNYHVRRLASEGIRPNLPWGGKITTNPEKIIEALDNLYYDKTRYVVRSVANNLNDISKIDYSLVLQTLTRWKQEGKQNPREFNYLVRHALRSQIKVGESKVMNFLGYNPKIKYSISEVNHKKVVVLGEKQELEFVIRAEQSGQYMIDYVLFFQKKDGTLSGKTFKIKDVYLKRGQVLEIEKKHLFRPMTTKQLYPGKHAWCVQINGVQGEQYLFDLRT